MTRLVQYSPQPFCPRPLAAYPRVFLSVAVHPSGMVKRGCAVAAQASTKKSKTTTPAAKSSGKQQKTAAACASKSAVVQKPRKEDPKAEEKKEDDKEDDDDVFAATFPADDEEEAPQDSGESDDEEDDMRGKKKRQAKAHNVLTCVACKKTSPRGTEKRHPTHGPMLARCRIDSGLRGNLATKCVCVCRDSPELPADRLSRRDLCSGPQCLGLVPLRANQVDKMCAPDAVCLAAIAQKYIELAGCLEGLVFQLLRQALDQTPSGVARGTPRTARAFVKSA